MKTDRQAKPKGIRQGIDEAISYTIDVSSWGSSPTSPDAKIFLFDEDAGSYTDQTVSLMSGACSVNGDIVTLPQISGLTEGEKYRVELAFNISSDTFECYFWIDAER